MTQAPSDSDHVRSVVAQPLTSEAFQPFGHVMTAGGLSPLDYDLYEGRDDTFVAGVLESDHPIEMLLLRSRLRDFRVRYLERHHEIAQAFLPLGGRPFICVAAAPDAVLEDELPALDTVHAFFVPGDAGVVLHRGTWHEPPFPLEHGQTTLVTSHRALTEALGSPRDAMGEINQGDVEKRNVTRRTGIELRVSLP